MDKRKVRVLTKDEDSYYYILKVQHGNSETLCFFPDAGLHLTEHESGEAHIQPEKKRKEPVTGTPIIVTTGSAGEPCGSGYRHETPQNPGAAYSITEIIVLIGDLDSDFRKYSRSLKECFIIDKALFSEDTGFPHLGLWYVPSNNKASFEFNNRHIPEHLLYKITQCEPQLWIFAKP